MGITDQITGRIKKAAGDIIGDDSLHREGRREERKDEAKQELAEQDARAQREEAKADRKADEVDRLERST